MKRNSVPSLHHAFRQRQQKVSLLTLLACTARVHGATVRDAHGGHVRGVRSPVLRVVSSAAWRRQEEGGGHAKEGAKEVDGDGAA